MRLKPCFVLILVCSLHFVGSVPLPNENMGADAPPLTISDTPSPYSPPPAADYIAPGEEAKPVAEPIPSYQDPNLGVYPAAPTSDQVPYQAPTSDSVPYQAPTSDQVPYQAPTDAITPDQPKTYSADAPPAQKVGVEERAASHSIHSSYRKELPYDYDQTGLEVETFDPYTPFNYDDNTASTPPAYPSSDEEQGDDNPATTTEVGTEAEDSSLEQPYPEEQEPTDAYPTSEVPQTPDQDSNTPYEETPQEEADFVDDDTDPTTQQPEAPYQEQDLDQEETPDQDEETPDLGEETPEQEETPDPDPEETSGPDDEETPYQEETTPYEEETPSQEIPDNNEFVAQEITLQLTDSDEEISTSTPSPSDDSSEESLAEAASSLNSYPAPLPYDYEPSIDTEIYATEFLPTTTTELPTTTEAPLSTFLQAFDRILTASDNYRTSLTPTLHRLVDDSSGRRGVVTCKLERTRIVVTKGVKDLLESYSHWVKLGTTIEESHCRQDSKLALLAFSAKMEKVSQDLAGMEDMDLDDLLEAPNAAFKRLQLLIERTLLLFGDETDVIVHIHVDHDGHVSQPKFSY